MKILYHLTTTPPRIPGTEAITQEIEALREQFGGQLLHVNPNLNSPLYLPRLLFGWRQLPQIRRREAGLDLHHFYNPDPFPFPYLRLLRRPVIYSLSSGLRPRRPNLAFLSSLAAVAVSDERSLGRLRAWGLGNCHLVRPGIDKRGLDLHPLPLRTPIRLLVGSAPWSKSQFRSKGVDALLAAARHSPDLQLVFLWRGVLADEMRARVARLKLEKQVTVHYKKVDVNRVLAGVHAAVTLTAHEAIVRSYPHSLIESLVTGKPILVSRSIPMADYVEQAGCGVVVEPVDAEGVLTGVARLAENYERLAGAARTAGARDFSQQGMIDSFRAVYEQVLDDGKR